MPAVAATSDLLTTDVPFDFAVNGKMFAAGPYTIERLSDVNIRTLVIRGVDSKAAMVFASAAVESNDGASTKLVFVRNGDTYSLMKIDGELATYSLAPTRLRREIEKHSDVTVVPAIP